MYIGERVKVINVRNLHNKKIKYGDTGRVISYDYKEPIGVVLGVEFDRYISGHNCDGKGKDGFCAYIRKNKLIKIDSPKIDIKHIADLVVEFVCRNSDDGNYIVDYMDLQGQISEEDFRRYIKEITDEVNKSYKVADAKNLGNEIDVVVWLGYLEKDNPFIEEIEKLASRKE